MSFIAKIMTQEGGAVRVVTAMALGEAAWYVIELAPEYYQDFRGAMRSGDLDLADYGEILESGWGEVPAEIRDKYLKDT